MKKMKMLTNAELSGFSEELANVLKAGIPASEGIDMMLEESEDKAEKAILEKLAQEMLESNSLSKAVAATGVFPKYYVEMLELGEETGHADEVLDMLDKYYDREENIRASVRSAISYPLMMIVLMILIVGILITKVMPIFEKVFNQLGSEMTGVSKGFLNLGNAIEKYSLVIGIVFALLVILFVLLFKTRKGKNVFRAIGYKFKKTRGIYERVSASRVANGLSIALKSGMTTEHAMETVKDLCDDPYYQKKVESALEMVQEYKPLATSLAESKLFWGLYSRMIRMSEKAGNTEEVLDRIADTYRTEADEDIDSVISVVEPTLVIVMSVIVGLILLSVMLPLLGIMSGIN